MRFLGKSREGLKIFFWSVLSAVLATIIFILWDQFEQELFVPENPHIHSWGHTFTTAIAITIASSIVFGFVLRKLMHEQQKTQKDLLSVNRKLRQLAVTDGLTGAYNHRYFEMKLYREWKRWERFHHPLACVMIDLDNFKQINDTHGHSTGDEVLKKVADTLRKEMRSVDIISRYGGEEFAIILFEKPSHPRGLFLTMDKIRKNISAIESTHDGKKINITASLGGAFATPTKINTPESLIAAADKAMYLAKNSGKNCCRVHGSPELK